MGCRIASFGMPRREAVKWALPTSSSG